MHPFADISIVSQTLKATLDRLRGHAALCIGAGGEDFAAHLRPRFERVETVETFDLEFESDLFDLVVFYGSFYRLPNRTAVLTEVMRILKPHGRIMVIDGIPQTGNERQQTHLMLREMLIDRDSALGNAPFPILSVKEMQRELKAAGFHHLRQQEYLQTCPKPGGDVELKEQALDILRQDVIPSLAQLGTRRSEIEKRLIEIKQRIERTGIEIHPFAVLTGIKKAAASRLEPNLFATETDTPTSTKPEVRYEFSSDLDTNNLSLEERLLKWGPSSLRTPELLAFLLSPGAPETARELSERILRDYGSQTVATERNPYRLKETLNISLLAACQIVASFEIGERFFGKSKTPVLRSPEDVYQHVRDMAKLKREHFRSLFLNFCGELVGDEVIATGNHCGAQLQPREIFRRATQHSAAAFILCHNHPSGDSSPSSEDVELTRRVVEAGELMGIELLDHIIITDSAWMSFRDAHLL